MSRRFTKLNRQSLAISGFVLRVYEKTGTWLPVATGGMKQFLYLELCSLLQTHARDDSAESEMQALRESLKQFKRTADGVCVLTARESRELELGELPAVVFIEAEHTSFLTASAIVRFVQLWGELFDDGPLLGLATMHVAVVGRYGQMEFISGGRLHYMWNMHLRASSKSNPIPHDKYEKVFLHTRVSESCTLRERQELEQADTA